MRSLKTAAIALLLLSVLASCEADQLAPSGIQVNAGTSNTGSEAGVIIEDRGVGREGEVFYNHHEISIPKTDGKPVIGIAKEFASEVL